MSLFSRLLPLLASSLTFAAACGGGEAGDADTGATDAMPAEAASTMPDSLPPGVTAAMVAEGDALFHGAAICMTCHGQDAHGAPNLGPNLTDAEWIHSDGSYDAIVHQVMTGVPQPRNFASPMPPKGGSAITDEQVRSVAAYVWSLSH